MGEKINAVLVHSQPEPFSALEKTLNNLGVESQHATTCGEASRILNGPTAAEVVFTDTHLPDGSWSDVVRLANRTDAYLPVVVVSQVVDVDLYLSVRDSGAFDFIAPPFLGDDLANIVRSAVYQELISKNLQASPVA